jgi:hypothetical protein
MSDFDWPGIPYTHYLQKQLVAQTEYEYINPALDRRYDPVLVSGNAMHPAIQRGDVILIDTGLKDPEEGQAVAVRVYPKGNTVIGYWRMRNGKPVLEQERTRAVINLAEYDHWQVYGVVTKIIGRGIAPHPPDVAAEPEAAPTADVSPRQALYVMERLIAEGRVSHADIRNYLREMQKEIVDLEQRIASLRAVGTHGTGTDLKRAYPVRKIRTLPRQSSATRVQDRVGLRRAARKDEPAGPKRSRS